MIKRLLFLILFFVSLSVGAQDNPYFKVNNSHRFLVIDSTRVITYSVIVAGNETLIKMTPDSAITISGDTIAAIRNLLKMYIELNKDRNAGEAVLYWLNLQELKKIIHDKYFTESVDAYLKRKKK